MCENCVRILKEKKHRQLRMFVILRKKLKKLESTSISQSVKNVKETGILIDKLKREKPKTVRTPENIAAEVEIVCVKRHQHQFIVVLNN